VHVAVPNKDGSGSGSVRVSTYFGSTGFGFGAWFSPTDFRVWIPESPRVWDEFFILPADHHWGPKQFSPLVAH
jgi:hypothetical protein